LNFFHFFLVSAQEADLLQREAQMKSEKESILREAQNIRQNMKGGASSFSDFQRQTAPDGYRKETASSKEQDLDTLRLKEELIARKQKLSEEAIRRRQREDEEVAEARLNEQKRNPAQERMEAERAAKHRAAQERMEAASQVNWITIIDGSAYFGPRGCSQFEG
jgi:hypothetical protein